MYLRTFRYLVPLLESQHACLSASKGIPNNDRATTGLRSRKDPYFFPQSVPIAFESIWSILIELLFVRKIVLVQSSSDIRHLSAHHLTRAVLCLPVSTGACLRLRNLSVALSFKSCLTLEPLAGSFSCAWSSRADTSPPPERHGAVEVESFQPKLVVFWLVYTYSRRRGRSNSV